ncbi:hypothetical protein CMT75_18450 [Elizabethkingia anophelis]|nr:hypothetical protein [Elizabethkingia anophelis]
MSKITVKRFLNKKVKPIQVYNDISELGYPLYYSITYQRKTQHIKSFTGAIMTEKAFAYLEENNKPYSYETNYKDVSIITVEKEKELIFNAVKFMTETEKRKDIFKEDFTPRLKEYFSPLKDSLFYLGWYNYKQTLELKKESKRKKPYTVKEIYSLEFKTTDDEKRINEVYKNSKNIDFDIRDFYYIFNQDKNLLLSIKILENITGIGIKKYFYENTLKIWYVIDLILQSYQENVMIEFIINYNLDRLTDLNKKYSYPVTNEEIKTISNKLKMNCLGIYYESE